MRKLLWWCAWSTNKEDFKYQLKNLGSLSEVAAKDLLRYPPQSWCRAYLDTQCKNNMVDNNFTESFNSWILEARSKPIIKMLEDIRIKVIKTYLIVFFVSQLYLLLNYNYFVKVMNKIREHEDEARRWKEDISPLAMRLFKDYRCIAQGCKIEFNGDNGYEVTEGVDRHTVNLLLKKCTCRAWDLSGIPCPHAIKALIHKKVNPLTEVHWWYSKEAYMRVYKHKMQPVRGEKFWKVEPHHAMEPPPLVKLVGRPRVKNKRKG